MTVTRFIPLALYVPGDSPVHRMPAGWKMVILLAFIIASALFSPTPWHALAWLILPLIAYGVARIPVMVAIGQILTPLPIILFFGVFTWWQRGFPAALTMVLIFTAAIAAATLLTLTTTIEELLDGLERWLAPLSRFGVNPELVALAISLTIRLIPLIAMSAVQVLQARKARGADHSLLAFGIPFIVSAIRRSQAVGDALVARGVGD